MDRRAPPAVLERLRAAEAGELEPAPVEVIDAAVGTGSANDLGNDVGKHTEAALVRCTRARPFGAALSPIH